MREVVERKKKVVAAGALALTLGAGLGLGAVAWGSEGSASSDDALSKEASGPSAGSGLVRGIEDCMRSHRDEVQRIIETYRQARGREQEEASVPFGKESSGGEGDAARDPGSAVASDSAPDADGGASPAADKDSQDSGERSSERSGRRPSGDVASDAVAGSPGEKGRGSQQGKDAASPDPSTASDQGQGGSGASDAKPGNSADSGGSLAPGTLVVSGIAIPYSDVRGGTTPSSGGGLWLGSDAVDDGSWGYFVGHNPGSFAPVRSLSSGDAVTVCDGSGARRSYTVRDVFRVEETATWRTIASRVTGYGESVVLQTCAGDGMNIIAVAA